MKNLSVIIPIYNEAPVVAQTIADLQAELAKLDLAWEIIAVNDCSTDNSQKILEKINNIKLINHLDNKGYGAALKTGIKNAQYDLLLFFDADGQHPAEAVAEFLKHADYFDLIAGDRTKNGYQGPYARRPGKAILRLVANYLTGQKIPDLNCGFRLIKKEEIKKFLHILPNGFSLSTTTTIAFLKEGLNIKFVPIEIKKRIGKSTVKPSDASMMFLLILRIILLFSPLKVFLPVSFILFLMAVVFGIFDLLDLNVSESTVLLFISSLLIFFFGLLADQIAAVRREIKK